MAESHTATPQAAAPRPSSVRGSLRSRCLDFIFGSAFWVMVLLVALVLWFLIHCGLVAWAGLSDSTFEQPVDALIVLGGGAEDNGHPGALQSARLDRAVEVYRAGLAGMIICSGGPLNRGRWESDYMRDYLAERGVPRERIVIDHDGLDTWQTAISARKIFDERGWSSVAVVSTYTHIARIRLALRRHGFSDIRSAHARVLPGDWFSLGHEFLGYYLYLVRQD